MLLPGMTSNGVAGAVVDEFCTNLHAITNQWWAVHCHACISPVQRSFLFKPLLLNPSFKDAQIYILNVVNSLISSLQCGGGIRLLVVAILMVNIL
jgi:hypothetical protein